MSGRLFLVATPIGNLGDVTERARQILAQVGFVACEDTRRTQVLCEHLGVRASLVSLPAFAEGQRAAKLVERIVAGEDCALVTDAGSPGISDPGEHLVREALERGVQVVPVPGATALVAALSASGLPTGRFHFLGFLPRKGPERRAMVEEVRETTATLVLYEAPHRLGETLALLVEVLGDRRACVGRELTKVHEEFVRESLSKLTERYQRAPALGEVVIVVEGRTGHERWTTDEVSAALSDGLARGERLKELSGDVARRAGWASQQVYRLGLALKKPEPPG